MFNNNATEEEFLMLYVVVYVAMEFGMGLSRGEVDGRFHRMCAVHAIRLKKGVEIVVLK